MVYVNFSTSDRDALDLFLRIFRGVQQHISIQFAVYYRSSVDVCVCVVSGHCCYYSKL